MLTFDRPWNDCRLEYFLESLNETLTKIQLTTFTIAFPPWRIDRRPSICQLAQPTLPCPALLDAVRAAYFGVF
jgi:hypothetical protein